MREGPHRVVVFSSVTRHSSIIEPAFATMGATRSIGWGTMGAKHRRAEGGRLRMKNGMDLGRLAAEPAIRFRPSLLLLAAFLSSAPLYPPNSYLMLRFASETYPAGEFLVSMLLTCLAAA